VGLYKNWDTTNILQEMHRMNREMTSPYTDGFTSFEIKKELYEIKFAVDQILKTSPTFTDEQQWLTDQEKKRIIKHLKS
jgi:hypothetical protein